LGPAADANVVSGGNADGGIRGSGRNEADAVMASGGDEVACERPLVRWVSESRRCPRRAAASTLAGPPQGEAQVGAAR
jgi:hypothetical protein